MLKRCICRECDKYRDDLTLPSSGEVMADLDEWICYMPEKLQLLSGKGFYMLSTKGGIESAFKAHVVSGDSEIPQSCPMAVEHIFVDEADAIQS